MKVVKVVFGVLAGVFAVAHCFYLPLLLLRGSHISAVLGSLAGLCGGAAISVALFKSASKKQPTHSE